MNSAAFKLTWDSRGQLGPVFIIMVILVGVLAGAMAIDFCHMFAVKNELQNATDAGALAGAQDLWFNIDRASATAIDVTGRNRADGVSVANAPPRVVVNAIVRPPAGNTPGQVEVTASIRIRHLFAPFFLRFGDTVSATSVAGTAGQLWLLNDNQAFPIAVSIDAIPKTKEWTGQPLSNFHEGDTFTLYIGSQSVKNAVFTSLTVSPASASYLKDAISQAVGLSTAQPGFIPAVKLGDLINLNNGIDSQKALAKSPLYEALRATPYIVIPIIDGTPPFNQSRPVRGFTAMKITSVSIDQKDKIVESITGTLIRPQVLGVSGPYPTTGHPFAGQIERFNLGPIQLIQ